MRSRGVVAVVVAVVLVLACACASATEPPHSLAPHTDNWVVLVDTSRFWFNYRHAANVYSLYHTVKRLGIPDSHILLLVSDGMACDACNPKPSVVFNDERLGANVYGSAVDVDYRGYEVTAEALMRLLTGRHEEHVPASKRLLSHRGSNILIYLTGHGGDEFFKFQDAGEITSVDFADAFEAMYTKGRYREMLVLADTCQGGTLHKFVRSPHIMMAGSSKRGENSWSHGSSLYLGTTMMDKFTHATLDFFTRRVQPGLPVPSMAELVAYYDPHKLNSHPSWLNNLKRPLASIAVTEFFGAVRRNASDAVALEAMKTTTTPALAVSGSVESLVLPMFGEEEDKK